jgi:hypothetical protein
MPDTNLIDALLGRDPSALSADVSFAPPLTLARVTGRNPVNEALDAYARALGAGEADALLHDDRLEAAIFTGELDGHTAQVLAIAERDRHGMIARIDAYGRPWPYMALVRERLSQMRPALTVAELGDELYIPDGPGSTGLEPPPVPPLAQDVSFLSPVLTAVATGKEINERILAAASAVYGAQHFRAVLEVEGRPAIAAVFDGIVDGNTLQLVAMFTLNDRSEIVEIRIFSRPWPITHRFRVEMYDQLKDVLGPEFWQGPDPRAPLGAG